MKKILFLSLALLLMTGCGPVTDVPSNMFEEGEKEGMESVENDKVEDGEVGESADEDNEENKETTNIGISESDLDNLKADINAMEVEDLGGFTN